MNTLPDLASTLQRIGLSEKEAVVYLALLSLETATAYQIALRCDVKKPTVYVILEDLRTKGLALKIPHAKKALFAARDIVEYLQEQENRIKSVRAVVPQLHALGGADRPGVYFFTGIRGIAEAMDYKFDSMRGKTFHSFYEDLRGAHEDIPRLFSAWDRKAVAADISFKIVMAEKSAGKYYKDSIKLSKETESIEIRFLKQYEFPSNVSIEVAEDFVRIMNEKNLHATIIDDKQLADAMRQIFNIVWEKRV